MTTITELGKVIQHLLTTKADELAMKTGFVERRRKVTGSGFAQALILGMMSNPASTREDLRVMATTVGMEVSTPGLDKRFNGKAVHLLDSLLAEAVKAAIYSQQAPRSLLTRFSGVYLGDSTIVALPSALAGVFQGNNGPEDAAVKVAVQWELSGGSLGIWLSNGVVHDQRTGITAHLPPAGSLYLNDLGFFNLHTFAAIEANGGYYFSRYKVGTLVADMEGQTLDLATWLRSQTQACELDIRLGAVGLPCRLLALPVPPDQSDKRQRRLQEVARKKQQPTSERSLALAGWTLYVTNVPPALLALAEAPILGTTRWQIECLFDLWKNEGRLDETRSQDPHRVLCEFYAKLLALLFQHWIVVVGCWQQLNRSLHRASKCLRQRTVTLADALADLPLLIAALQRTADILLLTCQRSKRASQPATFQRLDTS